MKTTVFIVAVACRSTNISVWNGFASPMVEADKIVCGQQHFYEPGELEFKSTHFRVIIRYCEASRGINHDIKHKYITSANRDSSKLYLATSVRNRQGGKKVFLMSQVYLQRQERSEKSWFSHCLGRHYTAGGIL